jgi:hypothetical protein
MNHPNKQTILLAYSALALIFLLSSLAVRSEPSARADQTIQHLISYVAESGVRFFRNAKEYTPKEAADHMSNKYRHFRDDVETPEDFIELCATKSLLSGKPYLVIDSQGVEFTTSAWLRSELALYRAGAGE